MTQHSHRGEWSILPFSIVYKGSIHSLQRQNERRNDKLKIQRGNENENTKAKEITPT